MAAHHAHHRHSISKDEMKVLPLRSYDGPIHLVDSDAKMHEAARELGHEKALGFDTETRPAFRSGESYPPSVVQLAGERAVYVFQLSHIRSRAQLAAIFADRAVPKAGVAIRDDIIKLNTVFHFKPGGFVELADLAAKKGLKSAGVRTLAGLLFGWRISKSAKISRWDAPRLTHDQVVYAATDAWICREIYFALAGRPDVKDAPYLLAFIAMATVGYRIGLHGIAVVFNRLT
jgi:ribonuclease D